MGTPTKVRTAAGAAATLDPRALAEQQLATDRIRTAQHAGLLERKARRMMTSPQGFLRGAAPLFYDVLTAQPDLAAGPAGEGWIVGDLHLENFGAYRTVPHRWDGEEAIDERPAARGAAAEASVTFHLNDFDDATIGPWRFDLLRLATSALLGLRGAGVDGAGALQGVERLLAAWSRAVFERTPLPPAPRVVGELLRRVAARSQRQLLDDRTRSVHGRRQFVRGDRYRELPPEILAAVPAAVASYFGELAGDDRPSWKDWQVVDAAHRVAGTGSLGVTRVAALLGARGSEEGRWILDLKEEGAPSATPLVQAPALAPGRRVVEAARACLPHPPRMLGATSIGALSLFVRRLCPQEDKILVSSLPATDALGLVEYFGTLAGQGHRLGATHAPTHPWGAPEREAILERAIRLAGLHEAVYLAYCRVVRQLVETAGREPMPAKRG